MCVQWKLWVVHFRSSTRVSKKTQLSQKDKPWIKGIIRHFGQAAVCPLTRSFTWQTTLSSFYINQLWASWEGRIAVSYRIKSSANAKQKWGRQIFDRKTQTTVRLKRCTRLSKPRELTPSKWIHRHSRRSVYIYTGLDKRLNYIYEDYMIRLTWILSLNCMS